MNDDDFERLSAAERAALLEMTRVLGTEEIKFVGSLTAPLFWLMRSLEKTTCRNGSLFFVNTGTRAFGVTAAHVVTAYLEDKEATSSVKCMVGRDSLRPLPYELHNRIIDKHDDIDIATLDFSNEEIKNIGRTTLTGFQRDWPPRLPTAGSFVTYAGWPGVGRRWLGSHDLGFGLVAMAGKITNAREACISVQIERHELQQTLGDEAMPENFDFGGMSGGPVLEIVQRNGVRGWMLAGSIFQGPNPSDDPEQSISGLEIIRIRPAHFINADGTLNLTRWEQT